MKVPQINCHARYRRAVQLPLFDFSSERGFESIKYFPLSVPDFSGGRMREAPKFVDSFASRKTTNPVRVNVGPSYQDGAFEADIITLLSG